MLRIARYLLTLLIFVDACGASLELAANDVHDSQKFPQGVVAVEHASDVGVLAGIGIIVALLGLIVAFFVGYYVGSVTSQRAATYTKQEPPILPPVQQSNAHASVGYADNRFVAPAMYPSQRAVMSANTTIGPQPTYRQTKYADVVGLTTNSVIRQSQPQVSILDSMRMKRP